MLKIYIIALVLHIAGLWVAVAKSIEKGGPITACEETGQVVADKKSCTRYHKCRELEDPRGDFTTDIAVCDTGMVFDMVTSKCVDADGGFLQDPMGCNTFYGCHATKETSEGYMRRFYYCSGTLRFHPTEKHCTFKTSVPDKLCTKNMAHQAILGVVEEEDKEEEESPGSSSDETIDSTTPPSEEYDTDNGDTDLRTFSNDVGSVVANTRFSGINPIPGGLSNIDKIAEVIRGQLLVRRQNQDNKQEDSDGQSSKKDVQSKLEKLKSDAEKLNKPETRIFEGIEI